MVISTKQKPKSQTNELNLPIRHKVLDGVQCLTKIQQLQKLQNRAARIITGSNYDAPSKPLIKGLGWKTIEDLIQYESQLIVFKSRNGLAPQYLFDIFVGNSADSQV